MATERSGTQRTDTVERIELVPKEAATRVPWSASTLVAWARGGLIEARRVLARARRRGRWLIVLQRSSQAPSGWDVIER